MKGIIVHYQSGRVFDKTDAYTLLMCIRFVREAFKEINTKPIDDYCIITSEMDVHGHGTHGCVMLKDGSWEYINPANLEKLENVTINF